MNNADQPDLTALMMEKIRVDAEIAYQELQSKINYTLIESDFKLGFHEAAKKYFQQLEAIKPKP